MTDGRFSGGTHGFVVGHITPEAHLGGPLALVEKGDQIEIDADKNEINILIDEKELSERKKNWKPLRKDEEKGVLSKYADSVASASKGAVTT